MRVNKKSKRKPLLIMGLVMLSMLMSIPINAQSKKEGPRANKVFIKEYLEALSGKEKPLTLLDKYIADSDSMFKKHVLMVESSFPKYELIAEDIIAENDKVVVRATVKGTHKGAMGELQPTGKTINLPVIIIYRIEDGKIAEHWMTYDQMDLLKQLGVMD